MEDVLKNSLLVGLTLIILTLTLMLSFLPASNQSDLTNKVKKNIVYVENSQLNSGGTGFYIRKNGKAIILTNAHVCDGVKSDNKRVTVVDYFGKRSSQKIINISGVYDLCSITAPEEAPAGLKFADHMPIEEDVYVFGHPLLLNLARSTGWLLNRTVLNFKNDKPLKDCRDKKNYVGLALNEDGMLTAVCFTKVETIMTNIQCQPGNSGSPVVNKNGEIIAVLWGGYTELGWSLLVPLDHVKKYVESIHL